MTVLIVIVIPLPELEKKNCLSIPRLSLFDVVSRVFLPGRLLPLLIRFLADFVQLGQLAFHIQICIGPPKRLCDLGFDLRVQPILQRVRKRRVLGDGRRKTRQQTVK